MANIRLENISKIYGVAKKKGQLPEGKKAVNNINLNIPEGSFTILVGPSGCGKTTLLRMIAGLETITLGNIYINDIDVTNYEPGDRGLAMVFQNYALYPHMTIYENIEFGLKNARIPKHEIKSRIDYVLNLVNLSEYANRRPPNLSGGQRQRVALARAIAKKPQVFLMDEPLSNLDAKLRLVMRSEIVKLHNQINTTTIYVTHDQTEAMTMASRIVVMSKGFVQQIGTPEEIYNDPCNLFVGKFIGSPSMNILEIPYEDNVFDFSLLNIKMDDKFKKVHDEFYNRQMNYLLNIKNDFSIPEKAKSAQEKMLKILSSLSDEKNGSFVKKKEKTLYEKIKNAFSKKEIEDTSFNKEIDVCNKKIDLTEKAINSKHNIIVGIRPEKLKIRLYQENEKLLKNEVKVFVTVSELLGAEYNVHFNFLDKDMVCKFGVEKKIKVGDLLILTLDLTDALFFDPITGARIK